MAVEDSSRWETGIAVSRFKLQTKESDVCKGHVPAGKR